MSNTSVNTSNIIVGQFRFTMPQSNSTVWVSQGKVLCQVCTTVANRHRTGTNIRVVTGPHGSLHRYCVEHGSQFLATLS